MNSPQNKFIKEFEFDNLDGHYLKLGIINDNIIMTAYSITLLDGIRYNIEANLNEINYLLINLKKKFENIVQVFDVFVEVIKHKNYKIEKENRSIKVTLKLYDLVGSQKEVGITLVEKKEDNKEFIKILLQEIKKLREMNNLINELKQENKKIREEIKNLKNKINKPSIEEYKKKFNLNIKENSTELKLCGKNYNNDILDYLSNYNLKDLKELYLYNNNIDNIIRFKDIKCEKLQILNLAGNKIKDISVLQQVDFKDLKKLDLMKNEITDITPLVDAHFEKLEILSLKKNKITNIDALAKVNFKELKELLLCDNNIIDITPLEKAEFSKLIILSLNGNKISNINPLKNSHFINLKKLHLNYNEINDIEALNSTIVDRLESLFLYSNKIDKNKFPEIIDNLRAKIRDFQF